MNTAAPGVSGLPLPAAEPAVELADVRFGYDARTVLDGISMTIPRGKVVAIMGGSGCGKTTILRLIGGQLRPASGQVRVDGRSVPDLDREGLYELRRRIGMLFQFGALFTDMTVFENVACVLREHTDMPEELIRDLVLMKLHATGGRVVVAGQSVAGLDRDGLYAMRRRVGMLFQFGALFTDLTVFDNVAFPLREHTELPEPLVRDLVLMKLNAVGLRGAASLRPAELSGGMARRVALARAVALDPMLVMYDEPFAGLDPISLGVVGQLIRKMNDALGITSVVVTHDVYESLKIVDYLYFVSEGRIVAEGTADEVRQSGDGFVRQFVDGEPDGPVPFHYKARPLAEEFLRGH
jgi:phospholipid/cholesterol/gamma-HCH transport system ATP-binding protein